MTAQAGEKKDAWWRRMYRWLRWQWWRLFHGGLSSSRAMLPIILVTMTLFVVYVVIFLFPIIAPTVDTSLYPGGFYGLNLYQPVFNADFVILLIAIGVIHLFLTCLPALMIAGYTSFEKERLKKTIKQDLCLCGLVDPQVRERLDEFEAKNSSKSLQWPTLLLTLFSFVMFGSFLLSHGTYGVIVSFSGACIFYANDTCAFGMVNVPQFLFNLPRTAAPISWAFLGAYFYAITVLLRRWQRSDITSGALWKLVFRFAVAFVLGMLLTKILLPSPSPDPPPAIALPSTFKGLALESIADDKNALYCCIAFIIGVVPDEFLRWVYRKTTAFLEGSRNPFAPSELQQKIDGLNFWQAERLSDEGIESVQDLAMTDIPAMLINIRFDAPHLLYWVDQALLCHQAGDDIDSFKAAHILSASDLLYLAGIDNSLKAPETWNSENKIERICMSLPGSEKGTDRGKEEKMPSLAELRLRNVICGLLNTPNVPYVWSYMCNTRSKKARETALRNCSNTYSKEAGEEAPAELKKEQTKLSGVDPGESPAVCLGSDDGSYAGSLGQLSWH